MKSIISRYGEMKQGLTADSDGEALDYNKVDTALKSIGISIKDAQGQFRDFDDVIFELSDVWNTLDKNTQRYIATIMAGNRQQSRFIALVANGDALRQNAANAANAESAGLLQYSKTLDTVESKMANLKTSFQQFYMSILSGTEVKGVLDYLIKFVEKINSLGSAGGIAQLVGVIRSAKMIGGFGAQGLSVANALGQNVKSKFIDYGQDLNMKYAGRAAWKDTFKNAPTIARTAAQATGGKGLTKQLFAGKKQDNVQVNEQPVTPNDLQSLEQSTQQIADNTSKIGQNDSSSKDTDTKKNDAAEVTTGTVNIKAGVVNTKEGDKGTSVAGDVIQPTAPETPPVVPENDEISPQDGEDNDGAEQQIADNTQNISDTAQAIADKLVQDKEANLESNATSVSGENAGADNTSGESEESASLENPTDDAEDNSGIVDALKPIADNTNGIAESAKVTAAASERISQILQALHPDVANTAGATKQTEQSVQKVDATAQKSGQDTVNAVNKTTQAVQNSGTADGLGGIIGGGGKGAGKGAKATAIAGVASQALSLVGSAVATNVEKGSVGEAWLGMGSNALTGVSMGASFGPWGMVIGGVLGALTGLPALIKSYDKNVQNELAYQKAKKATEEAELKFAEKKQETQSLEQAINELKAAEKNKYTSDEGYQRWQEATNSMASAFPQFVSYIDEAGNKIIDLSSASVTLTSTLRAQAEAERILLDRKRQEAVARRNRNNQQLGYSGEAAEHGYQDGIHTGYYVYLQDNYGLNEITEEILSDTSHFTVVTEPDGMHIDLTHDVYGNLSKHDADFYESVIPGLALSDVDKKKDAIVNFLANYGVDRDFTLGWLQKVQFNGNTAVLNGFANDLQLAIVRQISEKEGGSTDINGLEQVASAQLFFNNEHNYTDLPNLNWWSDRVHDAGFTLSEVVSKAKQYENKDALKKAVRTADLTTQDGQRLALAYELVASNKNSQHALVAKDGYLTESDQLKAYLEATEDEAALTTEMREHGVSIMRTTAQAQGIYDDALADLKSDNFLLHFMIANEGIGKTTDAIAEQIVNRAETLEELLSKSGLDTLFEAYQELSDFKQQALLQIINNASSYTAEQRKTALSGLGLDEALVSNINIALTGSTLRTKNSAQYQYLKATSTTPNGIMSRAEYQQWLIENHRTYKNDNDEDSVITNATPEEIIDKKYAEEYLKEQLALDRSSNIISQLSDSALIAYSQMLQRQNRINSSEGITQRKAYDRATQINAIIQALLADTDYLALSGPEQTQLIQMLTAESAGIIEWANQLKELSAKFGVTIDNIDELVFESLATRIGWMEESAKTVLSGVESLIKNQQSGFSHEESLKILKQIQKLGGDHAKTTWGDLFELNEDGLVVLKNFNSTLTDLYFDKKNEITKAKKDLDDAKTRVNESQAAYNSDATTSDAGFNAAEQYVIEALGFADEAAAEASAEMIAAIAANFTTIKAKVPSKSDTEALQQAIEDYLLQIDGLETSMDANFAQMVKSYGLEKYKSELDAKSKRVSFHRGNLDLDYLLSLWQDEAQAAYDEMVAGLEGGARPNFDTFFNKYKELQTTAASQFGISILESGQLYITNLQSASTYLAQQELPEGKTEEIGARAMEIYDEGFGAISNSITGSLNSLFSTISSGTVLSVSDVRNALGDDYKEIIKAWGFDTVEAFINALYNNENVIKDILVQQGLEGDAAKLLEAQLKATRDDALISMHREIGSLMLQSLSGVTLSKVDQNKLDAATKSVQSSFSQAIDYILTGLNSVSEKLNALSSATVGKAFIDKKFGADIGLVETLSYENLTNGFSRDTAASLVEMFLALGVGYEQIDDLFELNEDLFGNIHLTAEALQGLSKQVAKYGTPAEKARYNYETTWYTALNGLDTATRTTAIFGDLEQIIQEATPSLEAIKNFFEGLGGPITAEAAELLAQLDPLQRLAAMKPALEEIGVDFTDENVKEKYQNLILSIVDGILTNISNGFSVLSSGIGGTLSGADLGAAVKRYGLDTNNATLTANGYQLNATGRQQMISGLYKEAKYSNMTYGFGDRLWQSFLQDQQSAFKGYQDILDEIEKIGKVTYDTVESVRDYRDALIAAANAAKLAADAAEFSFMSQEPTNGLTDNFDSFASSINTVKSAFESFKNEGSIGYKDFYNIMDFIGKYDAEAFESFTASAGEAVDTWEGFINSIVEGRQDWEKIDIETVATKMGVSVDVAMETMATSMSNSLQEVAKQQVDYLKGIREMLLAFKALDEIGDIKLGIDLSQNVAQDITTLGQFLDIWESLSDETKGEIELKFRNPGARGLNDKALAIFSQIDNKLGTNLDWQRISAYTGFDAIMSFFAAFKDIIPNLSPEQLQGLAVTALGDAASFEKFNEDQMIALIKAYTSGEWQAIDLEQIAAERIEWAAKVGEALKVGNISVEMGFGKFKLVGKGGKPVTSHNNAKELEKAINAQMPSADDMVFKIATGGDGEVSLDDNGEAIYKKVPKVFSEGVLDAMGGHIDITVGKDFPLSLTYHIADSTISLDDGRAMTEELKQQIANELNVDLGSLQISGDVLKFNPNYTPSLTESIQDGIVGAFSQGVTIEIDNEAANAAIDETQKKMKELADTAANVTIGSGAIDDESDDAPNENKTDKEQAPSAGASLEDTEAALTRVDDLINSISEKLAIDYEVKINADSVIYKLDRIISQLLTIITISPAHVKVTLEDEVTNGPEDLAPPLYTGNVSGLALADGNSKLLAGANLANKTLVGELGPELAVYDNQYHILGKDGAEFVNLPNDAIVFNHTQTEGIIKGQWGYRGKALASGNVSGPAAASGIDAALATVDRAIAIWQGLINNLGIDDLLGKGGGGGGGDIKAVVEELQEWYNLSRQIANIEQEINNLISERNNIAQRDGSAYLKSLREQQRLLNEQVAAQATLLEYQRLQLQRQKDFINEHAIWSRFFSVDEGGLLQYNKGNELNGGKGALEVLQELNQMSGVEQEKFIKGLGYSYTDNDGTVYKGEELIQQFFQDLQKQIDEYDQLYDTVHGTEQTLEELRSSIQEINDEIRQNQLDLEQSIYDILVEAWEKQIDEMEKQKDIISETGEQYIKGLNDAIKREKSLYDNNRSISDREQLQRRLSLLRRSGGSASEIADLEKQLDSMFKQEYFTQQETMIQNIQDANEKQVRQLDEQIKLQQEALDYQKENGVLWGKVYDIMGGSIESILDFMQGNSTEFFSSSYEQQEDMLTDWSHKIGIWDADREYNEFKNKGISIWDNDQIWALEGMEAYREAYEALNELRQGTIKDQFANEFAKALMEGLSEGDAADTAAKKVRSSLTSAKEQQDADPGAYKNHSSSSGMGSAVGGPDRWYYKVTYGDELIHKGYGARSANATAEANAITLANRKINEAMNANPNKYSDRKLFNVKYGAKPYSHGGIVDYTGLAMVHGSPSKPEAFLNAAQTSAITDALKFCADSTMLDTIRDSLHSLDQQVKNVTNGKEVINSNLTISQGAITIQVAELADSYDVDQLSNDIMSRITTIASKTTGRSVNRR